MRSAGRDGDQGSLSRWYLDGPSPRHPQDEAPSTSPQDATRPAWRREVKTGAAICEANRIVAAKAEREAHKSQLPRLLNANHLPLPTYPRCQRSFGAPIGLAGHLRTQCAINPTTTTSSPTLAPAANPAPTANRVVNAPPPPSADIIRPAPTSASNAMASIITRTTTSPRTCPTDGTTPDVASLCTITTNTPTPAIRTRLITVAIAIAYSPHTSAWSAACESTARRLADQCLEHQSTFTAPVSAALTAPVHSPTAWVYQVTYASTRNCG
ncbi:hypothetical protein SprV_0401619000 [Sparganum proliferum]